MAREMHGYRNSSTYISWYGMKARCLNSNRADYARYGGRGITICERWLNSFSAFLIDMGERPEGMTLNRLNNDGNYEPANCVWSTATEQASNQRSKTPRIHCNQGHEFTTDNTYIRPDGYRECKTCRTQRMRDYEQAQRKR